MPNKSEHPLRIARLAAGVESPVDTRPAPINPEVARAHDADSPRARAYVARSLTLAAADLAGLDEGSRNQTLNDTALRFGHFVGAGYIDPNEVWEVLAAAGLESGLPQHEIDSILPRVIGEGAAEPVGVVLEQSEQDAYEKEFHARFAAWSVSNETPPPDGPTPGLIPGESEFWQARPATLGVIQQFARARIVSPWAVLGGVLARVVCAVEPSVVLPAITGGQMSLNLFVALTGASGTGKDAATAVAEEAVVFDVDIISVQPGSGEGIVHAFGQPDKNEPTGTKIHTTRVLFTVAEIDTFAALSSRKGATLTSVLRDCFGGAALGFQYADASKRLRVGKHDYRLGLIAGVQPGRAGALLDDADGGTPQRFLWVPTIDPGAPDELPEAPTPVRWKGVQYASLLGEFVRQRQEMKVCKSARNAVISSRKNINRGLKAGKFDGHLLLTRLKAAAALALLEGRLEVTEDDWRLSETILNVSLATRDTVVEHRKAEARTINDKTGESRGYQEFATEQARLDARAVTVERVAKWVVGKMPGDGESVTAGQIKKKASSRDRHYVDEALQLLMEQGEVVVAGNRYKLAM